VIEDLVAAGIAAEWMPAPQRQRLIAASGHDPDDR